MSRFIEGEARTQSLLFPERLDDWIEEDNPNGYPRTHGGAFGGWRVWWFRFRGIVVYKEGGSAARRGSQSTVRRRSERWGCSPSATARPRSTTRSPSYRGKVRKAYWLTGSVGTCPIWRLSRL